VDIDLAALAGGSPTKGCCGNHDDTGHRFVVHPRGHLVFRVGGGPGGQHVNLRRNDEDPDRRAYDTRELQPGDRFSGMLLRPGTYLLRNEVSGAQARVRVAYPRPEERRYDPPPPFEARCGDRIEPEEIRLEPLQGLNLEVTARARVRIELVDPDDGPQGPGQAGRPGWRKAPPA
jgi:hypothetical protein